MLSQRPAGDRMKASVADNNILMVMGRETAELWAGDLPYTVKKELRYWTNCEASKTASCSYLAMSLYSEDFVVPQNLQIEKAAANDRVLV